MKKLFTALALAVSVTLGGCAHLNFDPGSVFKTNDPNMVINRVISTIKEVVTAVADPANATRINNAITEVQDNAQKVCGIVPYAESIMAFVGTFTGSSPVVATAFSVATAMCQAFASSTPLRGAARGSIAVRARGVVIRGTVAR